MRKISLTFLMSALLSVVVVAAERQGEDREEFKVRVQKELEAIDAQIDSLHESAKTQSKKTQVEVANRLDQLKSKREQLNTKFAKMQDASHKAWRQLRNQISQAMEDIEKGLSGARDELKSGMSESAPSEEKTGAKKGK